MKKQTFYICSRCDKQFTGEAECIEHELKHGLEPVLHTGDVVHVDLPDDGEQWAIITKIRGDVYTFCRLYFGYTKLSDQSGNGITTSEFTIHHVVPREDVLELESAVFAFIDNHVSMVGKTARPDSFKIWYEVRNDKEGIKLMASVWPNYMASSFCTKKSYPRLNEQNSQE